MDTLVVIDSNLYRDPWDGDRRMASYRAKLKEKAVKQALLRQLRESGVDPAEIVDWLWEDFGKRVKRDWKSIESAILGDSDITPQDLAVFMIDEGLLPDEGAWSVEPATGLPVRKGRVDRG
ncbi:MAG: hypothetical protein F7C37_00675 [Desulfurococcales archaeon]|nr:hypothetical protein [Desulfurococcales archaeon]MCE4621831.1 hypothetical protein [Desulfurococcales archaeon]MCE4626675.1 hypothetical protein [Desulfurococcales archaeon]